MKFKLISAFVAALILIFAASVNAASIQYNFTGDISNGEGTVNVSLLWDMEFGGIASGNAYVSAFRSYSANSLDLVSTSDHSIWFHDPDPSGTTTYSLSLYGNFYNDLPADYTFDARTHLTTNSYGHPSFYVDIDQGSITVSQLNDPAPNPVPVPAAIWLFGSGMIGLVAVARRNCSS